MIQLINVTPPDQLDGIHTYQVRIKDALKDEEIITTFLHKPDEGLSRLLQKAALAVERKLYVRNDWW